MRKNLNFIPLNNDINKLSAFIPSLDSGWRANQRIDSKPFMVESLDAIREFQRQGWNIAGALENRSKKSRKVDNHFIKMEHPDFRILNKKGQTEAVATMNIQNSCNGSKPMELDLGVYRLVCSNGMVAHTSYSNAKVPHSEKGQYSLQEILCDLGILTQGVMDEFKATILTGNNCTSVKVKINAKKKSIQPNIIQNIPATIKPGTEFGKTTLKNA